MTQPVRLTSEQFVENGRDFVLASMDAYVQKTLGCEAAKGWRDQDLPGLLPALDRHFERVAARLADIDSPEPGSANIVFESAETA